MGGRGGLLHNKWQDSDQMYSDLGQGKVKQRSSHT